MEMRGASVSAAAETSNRFAALSADEETRIIYQLDSLEVQSDAVVCRLKAEGEVSQVHQQPGRWVSLGSGEVTVDSAADESCWPAEEGGAFKVRAFKRNIVVKTANGQSMKHFDEKDVTFMDQSSGEMLGMTFQVTEVRKPLAAVWRPAEKGNLVQFGQREDQCFVHNLATGKKIQLHKRGGSYVLKVEYMKWDPTQNSFLQGRA